MAAQGPQPPTRVTPRMGIGKGVTVSAAVALLVAMNELNRLSGQVLDDQARSWPFTTLMGPGRVGALLDVRHWSAGLSEGWTATFPAYGPQRAAWLGMYVGLDLLLIALYGVVVASWLASRGARRLAWTLRVLAVVDVLEDGFAVVTSHSSGSATTVLGAVTGALSAVKWLLLAGAVAILVYGALQPAARAVAGRWLGAFYTQRFSILAVLPIALLTIPAGSDLLDQLPDVQRRWVEDGQGVRHFAAAVVTVSVVSVGVLVLGRLRSGALWQRTDASVGDEEPANLWLGLLPPAVVVAGFVLVAARGGGLPWSMPGLELDRLLVFLAVPLAIVGGSALVRWRLGVARRAGRTSWFTEHFTAKPHRVPGPEDRVVLVLAGDILAAVSVVVAALGLVRSSTAVVALAAVDLGGSWRALVLFVVGLAFALLGWPLARRTADAVTDDPLAGVDPGTWSRWQRLQATLTPTVPVQGNLLLRLSVLVGGIVLYLVVGLFPDAFGSGVGVIATSLLALLAAALVVGGSVVVVQDRKAPEVFWFQGLRLRSLPVTTLLLLTVAFTSGLGSNLDIHGVRGVEAGAGTPIGAADRPTVERAVDDWVQATQGCGHTVTSGGVTYRLRPLFLLAAEGGGVRAAYWTTAGLDIFRGAVTPSASSVDWAATKTPNRCAAALFAGGASGGAVGLTVARFAGTGLARDSVAAMATPDALGAATSGLFVRDTAYAATGLPFFGSPVYASAQVPSSPVWRDRAGLMEASWERSSDLAGPFLPGAANPAASAATGALVLNSTRVADGCRMWVSQLALASGDQSSCDFSPTPAGHTVDLFAAVGAGAAASGGRAAAADDRCLGPLTAATGAMLASRFPFVTPSGVVGPCGDQPTQQLVDGGYVENSGLGTVVDLAPQWLREVQRRNTAALSAGGAVVDVLVPVVVYFDNGTGGDLVVDPPGPTSEVLVPLTTNGRAKAALVDTPALLRNAARLVPPVSLFGAGPPAPAGLVAAIDQWRPKPVVVVHQSTFPAVTAPLGWVLSQESMATMDRGLAEQADPNVADPASPVLSVTANGSLRDAIRLATPDAG